MTVGWARSGGPVDSRDPMRTTSTRARVLRWVAGLATGTVVAAACNTSEAEAARPPDPLPLRTDCEGPIWAPAN